MYCDLDDGDALHERLDQLFKASGDDRRPTGGRDAYFVVRNPPPLDPDLAQRLGQSWIEGLRDLATELGDSEITDVLSPTPTIPVLEGLPPKQPRGDERSQLLCAVADDASELVLRIDTGAISANVAPGILLHRL